MYALYKDSQKLFSPELVNELKECRIEIYDNAIIMPWKMSGGMITEFVVVPRVEVANATLSRFLDLKPATTRFSYSPFMEEDGEFFCLEEDLSTYEEGSDLLQELDLAVKAMIFVEKDYELIYNEMYNTLLRAISLTVDQYRENDESYILQERKVESTNYSVKTKKELRYA